MKPRTTIGVLVTVVALLIGGFALYLHPSSSSTLISSDSSFDHSPSTSTSVVTLASIENCTYTATRSFYSTLYGGALDEEGQTTTTVSYVTTASIGMTTGAVVTTTTSPTATPGTVSYTTVGTVVEGTALGYQPYLNEPYSVSCAFVK